MLKIEVMEWLCQSFSHLRLTRSVKELVIPCGGDSVSAVTAVPVGEYVFISEACVVRRAGAAPDVNN